MNNVSFLFNNVRLYLGNITIFACEYFFTFVPPVRELYLNKMKTKEVIVNWNEHKIKLIQKFAFLTDNDLALADGEKEKMLKRLQIELGMSRDELIRIIAAF